MVNKDAYIGNYGLVYSMDLDQVLSLGLSTCTSDNYIIM